VSIPLSRRHLLIGATALLPFVHARGAVGADKLSDASGRLAALEKKNGGRLGVFAVDTASDAYVGHRPDERFAMCSTFKFLLAAAVLERVDRGEERLDRRIAFGAADLDDYAPVAKAHVTEGMTVSELCAAMIEWSDNTAANLLLNMIGGPGGVTQYARGLGDSETRLDRNEPTLNTAIPGDERDTATPRLMVQDMRSILVGAHLSYSSRTLLQTWLIECKTGAARLRASVPGDWRVGDKTGTGDNGTANDIAILWPPGRAPILVATYYTESTANPDARNAVVAEVGRIVAETF
jgi:beta-lactamase class A